ncbi:putative methyltransferase PMT11 [Camellia lanceoleosa]|uniref:Methyltransferase PMT11 n=1 Tax=Camellia lanceoleosa TaxID=1840588 RepID=A0ACC0J5D7_9ERIC|nr:putative methyltransferase PMT11 [Camellia lanceoleosa]
MFKPNKWLNRQNVEDQVNLVLRDTEAVYEQSKEIAASQSELQEKQATMKDTLEESMAKLLESSNKVGKEISNLKNQAIEIKEEISKVGNPMSSKMNTLQQRANDTEFAELGNRQQEELLRRQELLQQAHDHLLESSKTILAAQEAFESKQASMFVALDKLFALHNAMLLESRFIKALSQSSSSTWLCVTFLIEFATIRYAPDDIEQQAWIISVVRSLAVVLASIQLLHAICTYCMDYELLNYQMLLKLNENLTEQFYGKQRNREELWDVDMDSEMNWSSWVDTELPEDLDNLEDPDYILLEEVGENSVATTITTIKYNLRFINHGDFIKSSTFLKISGLTFISLAFFYLGKHCSDGSHQLVFFNSHQTPLSSSKTPTPISLSPNLNKTFDRNSLINNTTQTQPLSDPTLSSIPPTSHPKPLSLLPYERFRIVDKNGTMADDFEVRDFNPGVVDNWGSDIETKVVEDGCGGSRVVVKKFGLCTDSMREYIPCLDNTEAIRHFNSTEKGERFERHCPEEGKGLNCLVPTPKGYRAPIP